MLFRSTQEGAPPDEPPAVSPPPASIDWAADPFAVGALAEEDELPDLADWAGETGGDDSPLPADLAAPAFDFEIAPEPESPADQSLTGSAPDAEPRMTSEVASDFDEPVFEWVADADDDSEPAGEVAASANDFEEPDLDEFLAPPPVVDAPVSLMDDQTMQEWLTELEGLVADVGAPEAEASDAAAEPLAAPVEAEDDWLEAFGFDKPAPKSEAFDNPELDAFFNADPVGVVPLATTAEPAPAPDDEPDFDDLLGPAVVVGAAALAVAAPEPEARAAVEPEWTPSPEPTPEVEPGTEPAQSSDPDFSFMLDEIEAAAVAAVASAEP